MLQHILILSALIWGVAMLFTEGMVFGGIGYWIENTMRAKYKWLLKPVILCPPCMASVYGSLAAIYLHYGLMQWLVLVIATAGINYVIANK